MRIRCPMTALTKDCIGGNCGAFRLRTLYVAGKDGVPAHYVTNLEVGFCGMGTPNGGPDSFMNIDLEGNKVYGAIEFKNG